MRLPSPIASGCYRLLHMLVLKGLFITSISISVPACPPPPPPNFDVRLNILMRRSDNSHHCVIKCGVLDVRINLANLIASCLYFERS
jgi:hypothetical protein